MLRSNIVPCDELSEGLCSRCASVLGSTMVQWSIALNSLWLNLWNSEHREMHMRTTNEVGEVGGVRVCYLR